MRSCISHGLQARVFLAPPTTRPLCCLNLLAGSGVLPICRERGVGKQKDNGQRRLRAHLSCLALPLPSWPLTQGLTERGSERDPLSPSPLPC